VPFSYREKKLLPEKFGTKLLVTGTKDKKIILLRLGPEKG
jgi:hypothetical protein